jgi:hypothetical protein
MRHDDQTVKALLMLGNPQRGKIEIKAEDVFVKFLPVSDEFGYFTA